MPETYAKLVRADGAIDSGIKSTGFLKVRMIPFFTSTDFLFNRLVLLHYPPDQANQLQSVIDISTAYRINC